MLDNQRMWALALTGVFYAAAAIAQVAGTPSVAQVPPATPQAPGKVVGSVTFGGAIQSGRTETRGYMGSASVGYMNRRRQIFRFDASATYSDLRSPASGPRYVLQDTRLLSLTFTQPMKPRISIVTVAMSQHDTSQLLDHRELISSGVAVELLRTPRAYLMVSPGVAAGEQVSGIPGAPSSIRAVGLYQTGWVQLTRSLSFTESVISFRDFKETRNKSVMLTSMLIAQVAKRVGLSIYYNYWREGILPPHTPAGQSQLGAGFTLTL